MNRNLYTYHTPRHTKIQVIRANYLNNARYDLVLTSTSKQYLHLLAFLFISDLLLLPSLVPTFPFHVVPLEYFSLVKCINEFTIFVLLASFWIGCFDCFGLKKHLAKIKNSNTCSFGLNKKRCNFSCSVPGGRKLKFNQSA